TVASLNLSREQILARLPVNVPTLRRLANRYGREFAEAFKADSASAKAKWRRKLYRIIRKARKLADELSPRTELLERWAEELGRRTAVLREAVGREPLRR